MEKKRATTIGFAAIILWRSEERRVKSVSEGVDLGRRRTGDDLQP